MEKAGEAKQEVFYVHRYITSATNTAWAKWQNQKKNETDLEMFHYDFIASSGFIGFYHWAIKNMWKVYRTKSN